MYGLEDPLTCLMKDPPSKSRYKEQIITKITSFHEKELRSEASTNEMMPYFNVSLLGLRGKLHPSLTGVTTTHAVRKMRPHIKMLSGNYLTHELKSQQSGGSPFCRLCENESHTETLEHLIGKFEGLADIRSRIIISMNNTCQGAGLNINLNLYSSQQLTQFVLDPSSINLKQRVSISHPILPQLFQLSRDFCFAIDRSRTKSLM